jgi:serine/threonine protein kinase
MNIQRLRPGAVALGRYQVEEILGTGGFGEVWRARDVILERPVAFKVIRPRLARTGQHVGWFRSEMRIVATLRHPNIVSLYDASETPSGDLYMVMEVAPGISLRRFIDLRAAEQAPFLVPGEPPGLLIDATTGVYCLIQAAQALGVAHALGIIHRDIKPENIMIREEDAHLCVLDWGIAKKSARGVTHPSKRRRSRDKPELDEGSMIVGTPKYVAPEMVLGDPCDHRMDIYSLGISFYELLTGLHPYGRLFAKDGSETGIQLAHVHGEPQPLREICPEISAALDALVMKMLAKDPDERHPTALHVADEARALLPRAVPAEHRASKGIDGDRLDRAREQHVARVRAGARGSEHVERTTVELGPGATQARDGAPFPIPPPRPEGRAEPHDAARPVKEIQRETIELDPHAAPPSERSPFVLAAPSADPVMQRPGWPAPSRGGGAAPAKALASEPNATVPLTRPKVSQAEGMDLESAEARGGSTTMPLTRFVSPVPADERAELRSRRGGQSRAVKLALVLGGGAVLIAAAMVVRWVGWAPPSEGDAMPVASAPAGSAPVASAPVASAPVASAPVASAILDGGGASDASAASVEPMPSASAALPPPVSATRKAPVKPSLAPPPRASSAPKKASELLIFE